MRRIPTITAMRRRPRRKERGHDRRTCARFDVIGQLSAALEWHEPLPIRNLGEGGALVESSLPLVVGETRPARLQSGPELVSLTMRVCHAIEPGERERLLVGLEFVEPARHVLQQVQGIIGGRQVAPGPAGVGV